MHAKTFTFIVGALLGIVIGEMSVYATDSMMLAVGIGVVQIGIYVREKWQRKNMSNVDDVAHVFSLPLFSILLTLGLCVGVIRSQFVEQEKIFMCETSCTFSAVINVSPKIQDEYQIFTVTPETEDAVLDIQIRTPLYPRYQVGEKISISGKTTEPHPLFPHEGKKVFDYEIYLATKNIGSEMLYPHIEVISYETSSLGYRLGRWRESFIKNIDTYISSPESSLAGGMLFGSSSLSKELQNTFRVAGLSHIIVLSGFNIALVVSFIFFVIPFLPMILRVIVASCSVILFVMMVGAEPSVVRATLMTFIALLATLLGRMYVAKQALIISLFCIVMYSPKLLLHDVSLHLSFLATFGIIYLVPYLSVLYKKYCPKESLLSFEELITTTMSAYLITLPYSMFTFGTVSVYALLSNIAVLPFVPLSMLLSFLVVLFGNNVSLISLVCGYINGELIGIFIFVARIVTQLPYSSFPYSISFVGMCSMYTVGAFLIIYYYKKYSVGEINETLGTKNQTILTDIISF